MHKLEIGDIRERQLNILISVDNYCRENKIRYFLCGGTLIGAVRHHGFIPWDDDIDISMPRPDYERFIESYSNPNYDVLTYRNDKNYIGLFTKISDVQTVLREDNSIGEIGVNIDLFPVDGLPSSKWGRYIHIKWMKLLQGFIVSQISTDISHKSFIRKVEISIIRFLLIFIRNKQKLTELIINQARKYDFDKSEYVADVVWGYGTREIMKRTVVEEYIEGNFEGGFFLIPKYYDEYLKNMYGDYMKLPPEEERIGKHKITAYLKNS